MIFHMKNRFFSLLFMFVSLSLFATEKQITSPDGKLVVTISDANGTPVYSVAYELQSFIESSPIGLITNIGDFSKQMTMGDNVQTREVNEQYQLQTIKKSNVNHVSTEAIIPFTQKGKHIYDLILRVTNNDVAFKYKLYPQGPTRSIIVKEEATSFCLPEGTTTFLAPQVKPMGGFARTYPSYETPYAADEPTGRNGWGEGYTFPCLFRNADKGWMLISETGVNGGYVGCRLMGHEGARYTIGFPQEGEMNGLGSTTPGLPLPGETPWRTITVGTSLAPIVETTITFDLVEPRYEASKEYIHGAGSWSWIIGMDGSTVYDEQIRYIDFSAEMGYESVLIDALWDVQIGRDKIAELARYAAGKNVGLFLWYNSNGYWNDAPQSPRGIMDRAVERRREMKWMQSIGIRGIKVDFFAGDKQQTMQLYEDILADANDHGLLVVFHGCTLPRGWERMYPNYASSEAVLASENLNFSQGSCDAEAFNATMHPFIRNVVGSMDFGGSALNKYYNARNKPRGSQRKTSDVFALATAVLFQSPVQHFALAPNNLTDAPEWAINFMKEVPTTWDDMKYIDGYPGKYVVFARKKGDKWYVAGVNAQAESVKLKLTLPMFQPKEILDCYSDDAQLQGSLKDIKLNKKQQVEVTIPTNGGILLVGK